MFAARPAVRSLAASKLRELFNSGLGRSDVLPFWVGEPDEPTPEFIRRAGMDLGKLIEYNTSCAPVFVQRAGIAALKQGEPVIVRTLERFRKARDFLVGELNSIDGIEAALPSGTMYAFFRVRGVADSLDFCKRLVRDVGLGLAPGSAFGPDGEGFLRWCFASSGECLADGVRRLRHTLVHSRN